MESDIRLTRSRQAVVLPSPINEAFEELKRNNKLYLPGRIRVPVLGRRLDIPYAYRNGALHLIKPAVFENKDEVEDKAIRLAVEGDYIQENPGPEGARQLVVISGVSYDHAAEDRVDPLFRKYAVRFVRQVEAADFASQVRQDAK